MREINVTRGIINAATKGSPLKCPIAIALKDATGREWRIYHTMSREITGKGADESVWYDNAEQLSDWIRDFDQGRDVKVITLWLDEERHLLGRMPDRY